MKTIIYSCEVCRTEQKLREDFPKPKQCKNCNSTLISLMGWETRIS